MTEADIRHWVLSEIDKRGEFDDDDITRRFDDLKAVIRVLDAMETEGRIMRLKSPIKGISQMGVYTRGPSDHPHD